MVGVDVRLSSGGVKNLIESREELHEYLKYEKDLNLGHISKKDRMLYVLRSHPYAMVWKYIKALRISGYYYSKRKLILLFKICVRE